MTETSQEHGIERTLNQDFVAPASCNMPIEVVSVRVREHQHQERDTTGLVRRSERMKEVEGGRRPTKGCRGTVQTRRR